MVLIKNLLKIDKCDLTTDNAGALIDHQAGCAKHNFHNL